MCLLVAQTIASELLLGGGVYGDYFNFFIKRGTVLFVSFHQATTVYVFNPGYASLGYISFLCCSNRRVFCFFALPKTASPFCRRRRPDGICLSVYFLRFATEFGRINGADKRGLFAVYVDSINNISWSKAIGWTYGLCN